MADEATDTIECIALTDRWGQFREVVVGPGEVLVDVLLCMH